MGRHRDRLHRSRSLLPDGEVAWVRRLEARDAAAVLAQQARLSGSDRHLRFLGVAKPAELSSKLSRGFDAGHTAVWCFLPFYLAGVACYDILPRPTEAEVALVVDGRTPAFGVAALLLDQLVISAERRESGSSSPM